MVLQEISTENEEVQTFIWQIFVEKNFLLTLRSSIASVLEYGTIKFDGGCLLVARVELKKHLFFPNNSYVPLKKNLHYFHKQIE